MYNRCVSKERHIVHKHNKTTVQEKYGGRKMLELLMLAFWFILGGYSSWFLFGARTLQPLTLDNLALTWKLHKQETGCKASRIHSLLARNGEVYGFKCDCGYKFLQKRLITQKIRASPQINKLSTMHTKVATPLSKIKVPLQNLGIRFVHVEKI